MLLGSGLGRCWVQVLGLSLCLGGDRRMRCVCGGHIWAQLGEAREGLGMGCAWALVHMHMGGLRLAEALACWATSNSNTAR